MNEIPPPRMGKTGLVEDRDLDDCDLDDSSKDEMIPPQVIVVPGDGAGGINRQSVALGYNTRGTVTTFSARARQRRVPIGEMR